mgnify:CR=1 FL=1
MEKASVIFLAFLQRNGMVAVVILAVLAVRASFAEMYPKNIPMHCGQLLESVCYLICPLHQDGVCLICFIWQKADHK